MDSITNNTTSMELDPEKDITRMAHSANSNITNMNTNDLDSEAITTSMDSNTNTNNETDAYIDAEAEAENYRAERDAFNFAVSLILSLPNDILVPIVEWLSKIIGDPEASEEEQDRNRGTVLQAITPGSPGPWSWGLITLIRIQLGTMIYELMERQEPAERIALILPGLPNPYLEERGYDDPMTWILQEEYLSQHGHVFYDDEIEGVPTAPALPSDDDTEGGLQMALFFANETEGDFQTALTFGS